MTAEPGGAGWRPARLVDLDGMMAAQARIHTLLQERRDVLADKLALFPEGCLVLAGAEDGCLGYALAHPWRLGDAPPLDALLGALPADADCLFIHDVALFPEARGKGAAGACMEHMARVARLRGLPTLALVSVYGTVPLWSRHGFVPHDPPGLAAKLGAYGDTARYMVARLA